MKNRTLEQLRQKIEGKDVPDRERWMYMAVVGLLVVFAIIGLVFVTKFIGFAVHSGAAGYIYGLNLELNFEAEEWAGVYGIAVRVPGYTNQQSENLSSQELVEINLLFDCLESEKEHEVYASTAAPGTIDWDSVVPASPADVDAYLGISSSWFTSATNTFTDTYYYEVGLTNVTNVPATFTYKIDEYPPATFDIGILKDGNSNLIFAAKINPNFTEGFNGRIYNYQMLLPIRNQTTPVYYFYTDPFDNCPEGEGTLPSPGNIIGNVTSSNGVPLPDAIIDVAGYTTISDAVGAYNLSVPQGSYYIYAVLTGYEVYISNVTVLSGNTTIHNIVLEPVVEPNPNTGPGQDVGPGQGPGQDVGPGEVDLVPIIEQPKEIEGIDYIVSISEISRKLRKDNFLQENVYFFSYKKNVATINFNITGPAADLIELDRDRLIVNPNSAGYLVLTIFGEGDPGIYNGSLLITGDINESIPVEIELLSKAQLPVEALLLTLEIPEKEILPGKKLKFKTDLNNLLTDQEYPVELLFTIQNPEGTETIWTDSANVHLKTSMSLLKSAEIPEETGYGDYILRVSAHYLDLTTSDSDLFSVVIPLYQRQVFGLFPLWLLLLVLLLLALGVFAYFYIRKKIEQKKRYHLRVEYDQLPKPGPRSAYVGKIAETDHKTYFDLEKFKVHTIVAGATGGGKSIAAQVIVEEALLKNVAVICFDPTAQWSGMLRKCTDKHFLALYPNFGMKSSDARAFNGNVRAITNPLELIDVKKYMKPGEIQIFAVNKLDPKDIDIFVANTVKEVFHANFDENPELRILLVYDEVHRLLPKFGGSGEGFLQIERACREFRKWGLGVLLISQVLADFVGQIKANINTEVQMRTRDEGDLERIRVKYGEEVLRSLVKAQVGTGMVENPAYNRGKPYFVAFRPILHNVARLSDEELEKYNKFNELIDDLEYQLEQLEEEKQDVFDLKLELKLALDKVKSGNFNMVEIYTEGLIPRVKKLWEKIGKEPKKRQIRLADINELKADLKKAKEEREKYIKEHPEEAKKEETEKKEVKPFEKQVEFSKALNFVNGMSVTSLQELTDSLDSLDVAIFRQHVNDEKNDIAKWVKEHFGEMEGLVKALETAKTKSEVLQKLQDERDRKPEKKEEGKKEEGAKKENKEEGRAEAEEEKDGKEEAEKKEEAPEEEKDSEPPAELPGVEAKAADAAPAEQGHEGQQQKKEHKDEQQPEEPQKEQQPAPEQGAGEEQKEAPPQQEAENPPAGAAENPAEEKPGAFLDKFGMELGPEQYFRLENGVAIKSVQELKDQLPAMDEGIFNNHVNDEKNDFANWIRGCYHDDEAADRLKRAKTKEEMLQVLAS